MNIITTLILIGAISSTLYFALILRYDELKKEDAPAIYSLIVLISILWAVFIYYLLK